MGHTSPMPASSPPPSAGRTSPPPILSDGVVSLRRPREDDADDITAACQDPGIAEWTTVPTPYTRADAEQWLASRPTDEAWWASPAWAVTVLPDDRWCGNIDLRPDGEGGAEVGYLLAPWARGSGHAARALRLVCAWAFSALGAEVVTWYAYVGNTASLRTARSVGFDIPDHVFRAYGAQRGARRDSWVGTLLPEDLVAAARSSAGGRSASGGPSAAGPRAGEAPARYRGPSLTRRERDVLDHLTLGRSNRQIADELEISENTVKNHVRSILEKLGARSRSEAVVVGLRAGLTTLTP